MTSECCKLGPCRWLLPLLLLTLVAAPSLAQSRAADRMSGAWTGFIGESAATPHEIRFQFTRKADGTLAGTATGPDLTPGELETGTFEAGTGALKFTVVIRGEGGEGGRAYFEGRVVHDTASGTVRFDDPAMRGIFRIVRQDPNAPAIAAPAAPKGDPGAAARRGLVEMSDWLIRAAEMVPEDRYSYRPVGTVRTFGQLIAHVVDGSNYYCARAAGRPVEWSDATERTVTTKPALVQALRKALADCKTVYEGAGEIGPMMENLVHDGLHYGNIVTYMRMMGLVPPSSG